MNAYFDINQPWISRKVTSNQKGQIYEHLEKTITRHLQSQFQKAYHPSTRVTLEIISKWIHTRKLPLILDSGCGVGEGSIKLADLHPDMSVLAIDKSELRIQKARNRLEREPENIKSRVLFIQGDLEDIFRELPTLGWPVARHYILYPCPWPKKKHFKKRWHGHPLFPEILSLCPYIHLRSDWEVYLKEFSQAVFILTGETFPVRQLSVEDAFTPYERKYHMSGYPVFGLEINLKKPFTLRSKGVF